MLETIQCSTGPLPKEATSRQTEAQQKEATTSCNLLPHSVKMTQFLAIPPLLTSTLPYFARADNQIKLGGNFKN